MPSRLWSGHKSIGEYLFIDLFHSHNDGNLLLKADRTAFKYAWIYLAYEQYSIFTGIVLIACKKSKQKSLSAAPSRKEKGSAKDIHKLYVSPFPFYVQLFLMFRHNRGLFHRDFCFQRWLTGNSKFPQAIYENLEAKPISLKVFLQ